MPAANGPSEEIPEAAGEQIEDALNKIDEARSRMEEIFSQVDGDLEQLDNLDMDDEDQERI